MAAKRIAPVHPETYPKKLLEELELSQYRLAQDIGVRFWLNLQSRYDTDVTEGQLDERVAQEVRLHKALA